VVRALAEVAVVTFDAGAGSSGEAETAENVEINGWSWFGLVVLAMVLEFSVIFCCILSGKSSG